MHRSVRSTMTLAAGALLALSACSKSPPPAPPKAAAVPTVDPAAAAKDAAREKEALEAGTDAYVYGYPLVTMELTRRIMTNVAKPEKDKLAPMGQLARMRSYPTPADKEVTAPNADTLYTLAWLDVGAEPWIVSVPDMKGRYFMLPLLSGWTDVFESPGTRTTGTKAQKFAVTGPGWKGKLPAGVVEYKSPTAMVWMLGRVYSSGTTKDLAEVHALQDKIQLVPLSAFGGKKKYVAAAGKPDPTVDMKTPVREQVNGLDSLAYFKLLASLLKANPPAAADAAAVSNLAKLGIVPGQDFDVGKLDAAAVKGLAGVPKAAQARILAQASKAGAPVNGWEVRTSGMGTYGTDYPQRAYVTFIGLGANRPQDAVYPMSATDAAGKPYEGSKKYLLRFAKGQLPPVKGFWSVTLYDEQMYFVPNKLNRQAIGSRQKFVFNKDGSLDLHIQKDSPGKGKEANWLPAPAGKFALVMRLYQPTEKILDGSWKPPPVTEGK